MKLLNPVHPGEVLLEDFIKPRLPDPVFELTGN